MPWKKTTRDMDDTDEAAEARLAEHLAAHAFPPPPPAGRPMALSQMPPGMTLGLASRRLPPPPDAPDEDAGPIPVAPAPVPAARIPVLAEAPIPPRRIPTLLGG